VKINEKIKKLCIANIVGLFVLLQAMPILSFAGFEGIQTLPDATIFTPEGFVVLFNRIIDIIFTLLLILAVILILYAAYKYMTSAGEPEQIKSANRTLVFALVAVAVAVLTRSFIFVVGCFFLSC
jgi:hypothetical protein